MIVEKMMIDSMVGIIIEKVYGRASICNDVIGCTDCNILHSLLFSCCSVAFAIVLFVPDNLKRDIR